MKIEVEITDSELKKIVTDILRREIYDYISEETAVQHLTRRILTEEVKKQIRERLDVYLQQINVLDIVKREVKSFIEVKAEGVMYRVIEDLIKLGVLKK